LCHSAAGDAGECGRAELDGGGLPPQGCVDLGELVAGAGQADLQSLDFAEPAFALGFGDAVMEVVPDLLQPLSLRGVWPQERAPDTGLTEMILVTYPDSCGLRGAPVLTDGEWQESWFDAVAGVSLGMKGVLQFWTVR
jgi:hypothetical protein